MVSPLCVVMMMETGLLFDVLEVTTQVLGLVAKTFFNAHELVVFANTVCTAGTTSLDETSIQGHNKVSNGGILGFARTVRDDGCIAIAGGQIDSVDGFGEGSNLVEFNEDRVSNALVKSHL